MSDDQQPTQTQQEYHDRLMAATDEFHAALDEAAADYETALEGINRSVLLTRNPDPDEYASHSKALTDARQVYHDRLEPARERYTSAVNDAVKARDEAEGSDAWRQVG